MTIRALCALVFVAALAGVASAAPVAPTSGNVFKSTSTSVFVQWAGGGPEYRIVSKVGTSAPVNDADGTVRDVGAVASAHVTQLRSPASGGTAGFAVTIAIYGRENGVSSPTALVIPATVPPAAGAANRHVDAATGADAGNCAAATAPCRTISYALGWASWNRFGNEFVDVAPGTHDVSHGEFFPLELHSDRPAGLRVPRARPRMEGAGARDLPALNQAGCRFRFANALGSIASWSKVTTS